MLELATFGVTVNCVSPGYVWTPLVEKQIPDTMAARNMTREQVIHDVILLDNPIDWTGQKKVSLALQGGGSHGAFTWGVLDYLLEDGRLDIEAITGTSAGAMNSVVLAEG